MTEPVSDEKLKKIIEAAKTSLLPYTAKPEMLDKYLPKPPFGFLQMLIRDVIEKSGYAEGLFSSDELNEKVKRDKEEKLEFLRKIINCVVLTMRKNLAIKPVKVAAGLEPEKTNLFLRMLVECAKNKEKYEWQKVVARIKSGQYKDVTERTQEKSEDSSTTSSKTAPAAPPHKTRTNEQAAVEEQRDTQPRQSGSANRSRPSSQRTNQQTSDSINPPQSNSRQGSASRRPQSGATKSENEDDEDQEEATDDRAEYSAPSGSSHQLARPSTARPAPPKLKNNVRAVEEPVQTRTSGSDAKREGIVDKPSIISGDNDDDDDGIIIENEPLSETQNRSRDQTSDQQTGFLVDQLRNQKGSRKEQTNNNNNNSPNSVQNKAGVKRTGIVLKTSNIKSTGTASSTIQAGGNAQTEVSKLRTTIQTLCTKTNPLGKTMEYIQEDLDVMQRELDQWKKERTIQNEKLIKEKEKTEEELKTLKVSISHIDHKLEAVLEKIRSTKANILRGDAKIEKLLRNVVNQ